jgi:hypothetical protein
MSIPAGPIVARVVKEGISARAGLALARASGVRVRDATWFRLVSEAKASLLAHVAELSRPLNRRPVGNEEITTMSTKTARGYLQYVEVFARDRASGLVVKHPYAIRGATLITRQAAIDKALEAMHAGASGPQPVYDESILAAAYTATYVMTPEEG